jgi:hypothetical protein
VLRSTAPSNRGPATVRVGRRGGPSRCSVRPIGLSTRDPDVCGRSVAGALAVKAGVGKGSARTETEYRLRWRLHLSPRIERRRLNDATKADGALAQRRTWRRRLRGALEAVYPQLGSKLIGSGDTRARRRRSSRTSPDRESICTAAWDAPRRAARTRRWRMASQIRATHSQRAKGGCPGVRGFPAPTRVRVRRCRRARLPLLPCLDVRGERDAGDDFAPRLLECELRLTVIVRGAAIVRRYCGGAALPQGVEVIRVPRGRRRCRRCRRRSGFAARS